ncbi:MAG: acyl-CoA dehydrogenase C-terminal domain-containing protein, partial [Pseudomonadota bacterium]
GIQAIDLAGRKLALEDGKAMALMMGDVETTVREARLTNDPQLVQIAERLEAALGALESATTWISQAMQSDRDAGLSGATDYLELAGDVIGGHFLTRGAVAARGKDVDGAMRGRMTALAGYFAETTLAEAPARVPGIVDGGGVVARFSDALFG